MGLELALLKIVSIFVAIYLFEVVNLRIGYTSLAVPHEGWKRHPRSLQARDIADSPAPGGRSEEGGMQKKGFIVNSVQ